MSLVRALQVLTENVSLPEAARREVNQILAELSKPESTAAPLASPEVVSPVPAAGVDAASVESEPTPSLEESDAAANPE